MTKSCERSSKVEFNHFDHNKKKQAHPYGASLIVLDFPVTFPRVACHLCCQVALGEAEGAALGVPTVQVKKWPTSNLINVIKEFFFAH